MGRGQGSVLTGSIQDDGLAAALIQLSGHAERIGGLDARETAHHYDITTQLSALTEQIHSAKARVDAIHDTLSRQAVILDGLDGLDREVAILARQLTIVADTGRDEHDPDRYQPVPAPHWWKNNELERQMAVDRLHAWVDQVYQPGYGRLAATLPACWEQHPLCLYILDWLSELWSVLYLSPERDNAILAAQAEWHTRLLPAAAEQMTHETITCQHTSTDRRWPHATGQ
jgi:hypothetical protein